MPASPARLATLLLSISLAAAAATAGPPDPAAFAGHRIGDDFRLVQWPRIVDYFELLARETDHVRVAELGKTTLGNRMIAAIISSPDNLAKADTYREIAGRLASGRGLNDEEARGLAARGKAIVAITLNLHSTKIASSQMALDGSTEFAIDALSLPVTNVLKGRKTDEFFCPGSLLQVSVDRTHPIAAGMDETATIFFLRSPAFEIQPTFGTHAPSAVAIYTAAQPLQSGWMVGEKLIDRRAALVEAPVGRGRVVLFGFRPQFRGQTYGTFRSLFNAIHCAGVARSPR